ncbi:hypothetical protein [Mycoplasma sp. OR1901]|uniref:hypothetical protein n=1 Tax=Mycoplasma sp. OR1901 TaxID=2742195 RepID=UPI00158243C0|nr:hypothetical protein [Mycoplasma sp. OR1901]QKT05132.1 hypothetical protein HTZ87_00150 [Mycoplasma sp. OR1901]
MKIHKYLLLLGSISIGTLVASCSNTVANDKQQNNDVQNGTGSNTDVKPLTPNNNPIVKQENGTTQKGIQNEAPKTKQQEEINVAPKSKENTPQDNSNDSHVSPSENTDNSSNQSDSSVTKDEEITTPNTKQDSSENSNVSESPNNNTVDDSKKESQSSETDKNDSTDTKKEVISEEEKNNIKIKLLNLNLRTMTMLVFATYTTDEAYRQYNEYIPKLKEFMKSLEVFNNTETLDEIKRIQEFIDDYQAAYNKNNFGDFSAETLYSIDNGWRGKYSPLFKILEDNSTAIISNLNFRWDNIFRMKIIKRIVELFDKINEPTFLNSNLLYEIQYQLNSYLTSDDKNKEFKDEVEALLKLVNSAIEGKTQFDANIMTKLRELTSKVTE